MSGSAHLSDLTFKFPNNQSWAMVRTHFDIQSFGVNAYIAEEPGVDVIGEHDELGERSGKHEELYFVSSGHAAFTVNGDEIDAPAGTFVFVRDPAAKRKAVAKEAGTTVLIVGGKTGEAFTPSPWERNSEGLVHFASKDYEKAIEVYEQFLTETPGDAGFLYNLACAESLLGRKQDALQHLRQSVEADAVFKRNALEDPDFDAIRDDPEFSAITGQVDSARSSS
jgi:tetratricopeptide (TPR) repeat protein